MEIKNAITPFEIKNSSDWPNVYSCRFLEDGIVSYKDLPDGGIAYLANETIGKMVSSFIGKPVSIDHQKITADNYEELRKSGVIVGNVIRTWKNPEDGWWWCDFLVDTDAGRQRINNYKDKVSCAYKVLDTKEGGLWHDIPYDAEIMDGSFTHLALVENPRYEGSIIREQFPEVLCNEKPAFIITYREGNDMNPVIEFMKNIGNKKEKIDLNVVINGKEMPLGEVLETLMEETIKNSKIKKDDETFEIAGKKYTKDEILNGFKKYVENAEKKNCNCNAKEDDMHKEDCPMYDNKKNAKEDKQTPEEKALEEEEKKNAKLASEAMAKKKQAELENAKQKELEEFFNKLNTMANTHPEPDEIGNAPAPRSRSERAKDFSALVKKNMGK